MYINHLINYPILVDKIFRVYVLRTMALLFLSQYPLYASDLPVNLQTDPTTELGRYLFNDVRLARLGNRSCALCHAPDLGWTNRFARTPDIHGKASLLNTPSLLNVADYSVFMQATPALTSLEATVAMPLFSHNPEEMGMTPALLLRRLRASEALYAPLFAAAFDGDSTFSVENVIAALVAYVATIRSTETAYHRYIAGDDNALSAQAQRGLALFNSPELGCNQCHSGRLLNGGNDATVTAVNENALPPVASLYVNTGLYGVTTADRRGDANQHRGLQQFTGLEADNGKFRIPSLVNVTETGPWGHDGSVVSLESMIDNYANGGRVITLGSKRGDGRAHPVKASRLQGFYLTEQDKHALMAFLAALKVPSMAASALHQSPFCQLIPLKHKQDPIGCIPAFRFKELPE